MPQTHKSTLQKPKNLLGLGTLAFSIIFHLSLMLMVGGVVLIEGVTPKNPIEAYTPKESSIQDLPPPDAEPVQQPPETPQMVQPTEPTPDQPPTPLSSNTPDLISSPISTTASFSAPPPMPGAVYTPAASFTSQPKTTPDTLAKQFAPSQINFFGITQSASRVVFLIDASGSMVRPEHGGIPAYTAVKKKLSEMIQVLDENTLFDVIIFAGRSDMYQPGLVEATESHKRNLAKWLEPYMATKENALRPNLNPIDDKKNAEYALPGANNGSTRMDVALGAAFSLKPNAIFLLSDGDPNIMIQTWTGKNNQPVSPDNLSKAMRALDAYETKKMAKSEAASIISNCGFDPKAIDEREAWFKKNGADLKRRQQEIAAEHAKGIIIEGRSAGFPPSFPHNNHPCSNDELINYAMDLYNKLYASKGYEMPPINCVAYKATPQETKFLQALAHKFNGQYSVLKTLE